MNIFECVRSQVCIEDIATHLLGQPIRKMYRYPGERTASIKIYPNSQTFYDFGRGVGGDCIRLWSHARRTNNWEALQEIKSLYGLQEIEDRQNVIPWGQKQERQRQKEREKDFRAALFGETDNLKRWADIYRVAIEKQLYEPFSDMWVYCINELQKAEYRLDVLCAANEMVYRRMKPKVELGLSSDRPQWLLDVLAILAESGVFEATPSELADLQAQRDFELAEREPGKNRECSTGWVREVLRSGEGKNENGNGFNEILPNCKKRNPL